jgi:hypothetical protein
LTVLQLKKENIQKNNIELAECVVIEMEKIMLVFYSSKAIPPSFWQRKIGGSKKKKLRETERKW